MARRPSARALVTFAAIALAGAIVFLLTAVMRQSLAERYPAAIPDAVSAAWTVGVLLIGIAAFGAWFVSGYLLQPVSEMRRNLTISARSRAVLEEHPGDTLELMALRKTLAAVLNELEQNVYIAELEKRRMLSVFESVHEGIFQVSAAGRFVHVNAAARMLLGLPRHPEGQSVQTLIRNAELRQLITDAANGEALSSTEITLEERHLLIAPQVLTAEQADAAGALITVVDLTELRRLESVRRDFVANVSHELKTPLTSIRGYTETLLSDDVPPELQRQFLGVIRNNAERLQRIVDELLDLSRLQSGGWQPALQEVVAAEVARDVWSTCATRAGEKGVRFVFADADTRVLADPGGLRQIFANLFDNALRYTPPGGTISLQVSPAAEPTNGTRMIDLAVRDNGAGIPRDALPRIFERFYRVDPARSRAEGGTGLGLSIVKHLADRMAGAVFAESELGKGTTIHVWLPAAPHD